MKIGSCSSGQNRDGIFKLFPLLPQQSGLRPRRIQQRLLLRHVQSGCHAALVPGIYQVEPLLQRIHCAH